MSSETAVELSEVPDVVLAAARSAVPGIVITEAETESTRNGTVYELEGHTDDKAFEIEITAGGEVLEVEEVKRDDDG